MKSILISIKPQWVAKILNREKTIEIRKTMPKCVLPIDVYIYCTKNNKHLVAPFHFIEGWFYKEYNENTHYANGCLRNMGEDVNGKVVAKFTLNKVEEMVNPCFPKGTFATRSLTYETFLKQSCLTEKELDEYINKGDRGYAWHISNLAIFDKPKELSEFAVHKILGCEGCCEYCENQKCRLTKAPQSWCYVEVEE